MRAESRLSPVPIAFAPSKTQSGGKVGERNPPKCARGGGFSAERVCVGRCALSPVTSICV